MGGEREKILEQSKPATIAEFLQSTIVQGTQTIRVHENKKEKTIHFHVDANKLKTAVRTPTWYNAWEKIRIGENRSFIDHRNKTIMTITVSHDDQGTVEAVIQIVPLQNVGPVFTELSKFTEGQ